MRSKTNFWKRSMAALLSFVMILGMVPAFSLTADAYTHTLDNGTQGDTYISLPITIRDFPADGMLFENNEYGNTGDATVSAVTTMSVKVNTWDASGNNVMVYSYSNATTRDRPNKWWLAIYVNSDGSVNRIYKSGETTGSAAVPSGGMVILAHSNCTAYYNTLNTVTTATKGNYTFTRSGTTLSMAHKDAVNGTFHYGNTVGFGLVATNTSSHDQLLTPANGQTIAGTEYIAYGGWAMSPDDMTTNGYTGAYYYLNQENDQTTKQWVHGALIRTNLTEPRLDANKNLVYTQAAVDYLASYMEATLTEVWQNTDGTYNLWFVMGDKLFNDNNQYVGKGASNATRDLAAVLRSQITGKGSYAEAKADYTSGKLATIQDINSYYDAAYFLLHTTFDDVQGYGMTAPEYDEVRLVKKTKSDGTVYYTFNSAFDDTTYNYNEGYIVNSQTTKVTDRAGTAGGNAYTRGNIQALNRFDPLGPSGAGKELGYGMSGSVYKEYYTTLGASDAVNDDTVGYYENTNYNLSLEGHAQFIYYEDDELYFTFTGDDDVYLFINGVRVLDVGGAHAIGKVEIKLNDVAALCGLRDGQAYDFDFYYMERHGTAANFGIETNIRIVDPAMTTTKTGYQNGVNTGYNGFVDPLVPVTYEFSLENKGEADIQELTFTDADIGVTLTKDAISLNSETTINDLSVTVYNANGTAKETVAAGSLTAAKLQELLAAGLSVNEKIVIHGFNYIIPTEKWTAGNGSFPNTVYTTAISIGENNSTHNLNGMAQWLVQKRQYKVKGFHVYEWLGKGVTLTKDELLQPVVDAVPGFIASGATIVRSSASGATSGVNVNPNAVLNSDGSITYIGTKTGADTFYYKVTKDNVTVIIGVAVYSYDVADNTYVLDYGLSVELNGDDFGLRVNDTLKLADNPNATTAKVTGIENATSNYGDFTWADPSLKYTPDDIIDNTDSVQANVQVLEDGATELTKFTGVAMYETITTAPANVVYYEENFPGITYVNSGENNWAHYETVDDEGNSVAGTEQSADQDSNYGSDPNYEEDKVGIIVSGDDIGTVIETTTLNLDTSDLDALQASGIEYLNEYMGLGGSDSNGTVNQLVVNTTAEVMYFDFVGTGFEIISRTTDDQYAVINVQVQKDNGDGTYTVVAQKPVITESKGGDLYQVPIISITGLERAEYRVVVKAAGSTANKTRVLYIDGIRIYGPLENGDALEYYNPEEYQAEFFEVKQLIKDGKMIYADVSTSDDELLLITGTTMVEDVSGEGPVLTSLGDDEGEEVEDYLQIGPNNELYLDGNSTTGVISFFLTPVADYPDTARTLEIGAHRKSDSGSDDNSAVCMVYGSHAQEIIDGVNSYDVSTGTEMYYTIDVDNLTYDETRGNYLVVIGTIGSEWGGATLALTSIKVAGYEISFAQTAIETAAADGNPLNTPIVAEPFAVLSARLAAVEVEPEVEQIPVNENLTVHSASLKASKVVSGKVATVTVKAGADAETIVLTDADGNVVEATRCVRKVSGDVATFTFIWTVTGSRGDALDFSIRVYDAEGLASVNAETVTVTIK